MSTNVTFKLDVTGAQGARAAVEGVRNGVNQTKAAFDAMNRARGLAVQQEIRNLRQQEQAARASLQVRLADFKRAKADEQRAAEQASRQQAAEFKRLRAEQEREAAASHRRLQAREREHSAAMIAMMRRQAQAAREAAGGGGAGGGGGVGGGGSGLSSAAGGLAGSMGAGAAMRLGARVLGPIAIGKVVSDSVNEFASIEKMQVALEMLFNSGSKAAQVMKEMTMLSQKTGVGVERFAKAATTMNGFGVSADMIIPKLTQIATITRGDAEKMDRLSLAFAQSAGQGRLMAEELNQMIDAGFNPLLQISQDTGLSIVELRKQMRDGKLDFDLLATAMDNLVATGGRYDGMLDAMEKTTAVKLAKMGTAWTNLYRSIGKALASEESKLGEATGAATGGLTGLLNGLAQGISTMTARSGNPQASAYADSWTAQASGNMDKEYSASSGMRAAQESIKLDAEIQKGMARRSKEAEDAEKAAKKARAEEVAHHKAVLMTQAQQIQNAYRFNKIQLDAAKDYLEAQKKVLETVKKQITEAKKNLVSAVKDFAGLDPAEQKASLAALEKARNGKQLTFDETDKLEAIGSKEAKGLATKQRENLVSGDGIRQLSEEEYRAKDKPINDKLEALRAARDKIANAGRKEYETREIDSAMTDMFDIKGANRFYSVPTGNMLYSKKQKDEMAALDGQISDQEIARSQLSRNMQAKEDSAIALRDNLYGKDQEEIRKGVQGAQQLSANIQQTIQVQANFSSTAQQIGEQVKAQLDSAVSEQAKEILKVLKPLMEQVKKDQMNNTIRSDFTSRK